MGYVLLSTQETVLDFGPQSVLNAITCTIATTPHGARVFRTIAQADFAADRGHALLSSLADAVEGILGEGTAIAAFGGQAVDAANLLTNYVTFVVSYTPPGGVPGAITADADVPVDVLTADTQFGSFLSGGSAAEIIDAAYQRLVAMASG